MIKKMKGVGSCQSPDRFIKAPPDIWNSAEDDVTWPLSFSSSFFVSSSKLSFSPESSSQLQSQQPPQSQFLKDLFTFKPKQKKVSTDLERKESWNRLVAFSRAIEPNCTDKNKLANLIINKQLTYQQANGISKISVKRLTLLAHRKQKFGYLNEKSGRPKLLDLISEEKIIKECNSAATEPEQVSSKEFKKLIKASIRYEILETWKRKNSETTSTRSYEKACSKTVNKYLNEFSQKHLKTF